MSAQLFTAPEPPARDDLARLSYRYFDRYPTESLIAVRERLTNVLDDRARQGSLFDEGVSAHTTPQACAPAAAIPDAAAASSDVAYSLSPSQVNCYLHDCQVKWYYRYVLRLPESSDANRALGRAFHAAIGQNFKQKIETREDLPVEGVLAIFRDALRCELENVDGDLDRAARDELDATGAALIAVYMDQGAPSIEPAAVERKVAGEIGGVPVRGYIDLLDVHGNIIDFKSAAKKPSGVRPDYRLQLATYAMLEPEASGRARLDTVTKTKTVQLHQQTIDVIDCDRKMAERLYPLAQESMRAGIYTPNRGSYLCSRKYCSFWQRCSDEYGGEVE